MEMQYPVFTEDMKKTHTILIPNICLLYTSDAADE